MDITFYIPCLASISIDDPQHQIPTFEEMEDFYFF